MLLQQIFLYSWDLSLGVLYREVCIITTTVREVSGTIYFVLFIW